MNIYIYKKSLIILFISYLSLGLKMNGNYWKLVKDSKGVKAYTRNTENSDIKQVKIITNVRSSLSALVALVRDVESHTQWIYRCKKAKKIKIVSPTEHYYYIESEAPWPVSNRDIITHSKIIQNKKTKKVTIISTGVPDFIGQIEGIVRIKNLNAKWEFTPKNNGTVDVTFYMLIDIGGNLPSWVINLAIEDGPFETVLNMKEIVKKGKYKNAELNFIKEL